MAPALFISRRVVGLRDAETLARIRGLVIPPAWADVWISPSSDSHLQVTGRDVRATKSTATTPNGAACATRRNMTSSYSSLGCYRIRGRVDRDLARRGCREKVLATVVRLLETTLIRVGNDEYARENGSFGLTTMRDRHVGVNGNSIRFRFRGKSGIARDIDLHCAAIGADHQALPRPSRSRAVSVHRRGRQGPGYRLGRCECLPAPDLGGGYQRQGFSHVGRYRPRSPGLARVRGIRFRRTREAICHVARIEAVAKRLGNTQAVCRKCYVHPAIIEAYLDRSLMRIVEQRAAGELRGA